MQARMKNPAMVLGAMEPFQALFKAVYTGGVDPATLELVHLRVSQINGCSACMDSGAKAARKAPTAYSSGIMLSVTARSAASAATRRLPASARSGLASSTAPAAPGSV